MYCVSWTQNEKVVNNTTAATPTCWLCREIKAYKCSPTPNQDALECHQLGLLTKALSQPLCKYLHTYQSLTRWDV